MGGSLLFKSSINPEWWSDRIQPWVHYVPINIDYSDLHDAFAFVSTDRRPRTVIRSETDSASSSFSSMAMSEAMVPTQSSLSEWPRRAKPGPSLTGDVSTWRPTCLGCTSSGPGWSPPTDPRWISFTTRVWKFRPLVRYDYITKRREQGPRKRCTPRLPYAIIMIQITLTLWRHLVRQRLAVSTSVHPFSWVAVIQ